MSTRESHDADRLSIASIDDYVSGATDDSAIGDFEAALFDAAARGEDVAFVDRFARDAAHLSSRGTYHPGCTQRVADALLASGRRVVWHDIPVGGNVAHVKFPRDSEFLLVRSRLDLTGVKRIEVDIEIPGMGVVKTMRDSVFEPSDNALFALCEAPLVIEASRTPSIWHCYAVEGDSRRELAAIELRLDIVD